MERIEEIKLIKHYLQ